MSRRRIEDFVPKHIPVIRVEKTWEILHPGGGDGNTVLTFTKTCGLPLITERGDCWELALSREYREVESSKKIDAHQIY
jgi:hypothetical protein